jgi:signal transduction histidine kinase
MRSSTLLRTVLGLTFLAELGLLLWSRTLSFTTLAPVAALLVGVALLERRRWREEGAALAIPVALGVLALALVAAGATTARLVWGSGHWASVTEARETELAARLDERLDEVLERARTAARGAAGPGVGFEEVAALRTRTGVDAVARVGRAGRLEAWAGDHRGRVPPSVLAADEGVHFPGGTLFEYLYVVAPGADGITGMAAVLIQVGPPIRGETEAFVERFEAVTGERPRFGAGETAEADWHLRTVDGAPVLSARFPDLSPAEWQTRVARIGRQLVFLASLVALALLASVWLRSLPPGAGLLEIVPMAGLSMLLMTAPLRRTLGLDRLFSPGWFVLPVPGDFVIEGVMVVLLPLAALISTLRPPAVRKGELWLRLMIAGALTGGGFAIGAAVMAGSAGVPMLTSSGPLWYVLHPTTVVLLTALGAVLIPRAAVPDSRRRVLLYGAGGVALSVALALAVSAGWGPGDLRPAPILLAWALPFVLLARGVAGYAGGGDRLVRWLAAGWLAATAVIPHLWIASQEARLEEAGSEVLSLGARGDPFLSYLLDRMGEEVLDAAERGERDVNLLYEAWVASGLASEPYPAELSTWVDTGRVAHLPLGVELAPDAPGYREVRTVVREAVADELIVNAPASGGGVSRILAVPIGAGRAVAVAVAPRVSFRPTSALTTFMEGEPQPNLNVDLLPVSAVTAPGISALQWQKTRSGWRSETVIREGTDIYHAQIELRLAPAGVRLARAVLLVTLDLLLLTLLWAFGRVTRGDPPIPAGGWLGWLGGFRARLIVALFAFFLLPTAVFGWAAYRALADEVTRAARQVAERGVLHAAELLPQTDLREVARRTGEDLLYYRRGTLGAASVPEAAELGLYSAWVPPDLYQALRATRLLGGTKMDELAGRSYLVAYRRLRNPAEVVGVPVWLAARDVAVRQREFAHLVIFGILVGGVLSLALSVLVGRALAQPIGELRRAAGAVGRGHFRVRLPERRPDEFGELFGSFNQMARRLRRARAQELRTARILAWGEMARQVAHEIKNPLTPIKLSVQHIRRAYRDRRDDFERILESNVDQILNEIERLTDIARAFSRYGAPEEAAGETEPVDVAAVARDVLTLYRAPDRDVRYRLEIGDGPIVAAARGRELREVIVNLLENARAAVGESGRVEVRVRGEPGRVRLEVMDDGEGIPPDQLSRIFEPHFSTRSSGTGLGLAIVRRLVESWGGEVGAESEPGVGTVMWVTVPKHQPAPPPDQDDAGSAPDERGDPEAG